MSVLSSSAHRGESTARVKARGGIIRKLLLLTAVLKLLTNTVKGQICGGQSWLQAWNGAFDVTY